MRAEEWQLTIRILEEVKAERVAQRTPDGDDLFAQVLRIGSNQVQVDPQMAGTAVGLAVRVLAGCCGFGPPPKRSAGPEAGWDWGSQIGDWSVTAGEAILPVIGYAIEQARRGMARAA